MLGDAFFMTRCGVQSKPPWRLRSTGHQAWDGVLLKVNWWMSDFLHGFAILTWMRFFPQAILSGKKPRNT
jgi:hypothetical protein